MKKSLSIFLLTFSLTGCAINENNVAPSTMNEVNSSGLDSMGTNGVLISIISDNVNAAGYDSDSKVMSVQFDNGALYEYFGVPYQLWRDFLAAQPHPWSQVGYPQLVQAGIPYKRVR
jgi:hypothetical protein